MNDPLPFVFSLVLYALLLGAGALLARLPAGRPVGLELGRAGGGRATPASERAYAIDFHIGLVSIIVAVAGLGLMVTGAIFLRAEGGGWNTAFAVALGGIGLVNLLGGVLLLGGAGPLRRLARIVALATGLLLSVGFPIGTAIGIYFSWALVFRAAAARYF